MLPHNQPSAFGAQFGAVGAWAPPPHSHMPPSAYPGYSDDSSAAPPSSHGMMRPVTQAGPPRVPPPHPAAGAINVRGAAPGPHAAAHWGTGAYPDHHHHNHGSHDGGGGGSFGAWGAGPSSQALSHAAPPPRRPASSSRRDVPSTFPVPPEGDVDEEEELDDDEMLQHTPDFPTVTPTVISTRPSHSHSQGPGPGHLSRPALPGSRASFSRLPDGGSGAADVRPGSTSTQAAAPQAALRSSSSRAAHAFDLAPGLFDPSRRADASLDDEVDEMEVLRPTPATSFASRPVSRPGTATAANRPGTGSFSSPKPKNQKTYHTNQNQHPKTNTHGKMHCNARVLCSWFWFCICFVSAFLFLLMLGPFLFLQALAQRRGRRRLARPTPTPSASACSWNRATAVNVTSPFSRAHPLARPTRLVRFKKSSRRPCRRRRLPRHCPPRRRRMPTRTNPRLPTRPSHRPRPRSRSGRTPTRCWPCSCGRF